MALLERECPPAYSHDPDSLTLPAVPSHALPSPSVLSPPVILPDLKSLGLPTARTAPHTHALYPSDQSHQSIAQWSNQSRPFTASSETSNIASQYSSTLPRVTSPMDTESVVSSENRGQRAPSVMSLDDIETREAAETLSGLKNMDFHRSPSSRSSMTVQPSVWMESGQQQSRKMSEGSPEPLLSLLTSSHPWLGGTINGSLYAYNSTMHYSPAFIRSSASFLERNIGSPVASGLGTVSRRTGVENRVRRYLGDRRLSDSERDPGRVKRRRVRDSSSQADVEKGYMVSPVMSTYRSRAGSQASFAESLPAYDENRSPNYEENAPLAIQQPDRNWRTKFMITTSGLGAALSESSLKNLKYTLTLLRTATDHLACIMRALQSLIDDHGRTTSGSEHTSQDQQQKLSLTHEQEAASRAIAARIKELGSDIMSILHSVTDSVSRYAGSALPENAGALVRRQLLSVPQRWRVAEASTATTAQDQGQSANDEAARAGKRFLVFAGQGCDMITQISLVVSGTVESAEKWLDSMGRRPENGAERLNEKRSSGGPSDEKRASSFEKE